MVEPQGRLLTRSQSCDRVITTRKKTNLLEITAWERIDVDRTLLSFTVAVCLKGFYVMLSSTVIRLSFAVAILVASLSVVLHVHFPSATAARSQGVISKAHGACERHQSSTDSPVAPGESSSHECHFCKLLSQISGETLSVAANQAGDLAPQQLLGDRIQPPRQAAYAYL